MRLFRRLRGPASINYPSPWKWLAAFSLALCVATGGLVALGSMATRAWSTGSRQLLERRQSEALELVSAVLKRDMTGAWTTVIAPINPFTIAEEPPYDLIQLTARAFARYSYPESFIVWKNDGSRDGLTYVFNRNDRRPRWDRRLPSEDPFPVVLVRDPPALRAAVTQLRRQAELGNSFVLLEMTVDSVPYQVVAQLMFKPSTKAALIGLVAFTVDLAWMKREYFKPLLKQVETMGGYEGTLSLAVIDPGGTVVAANGPEYASTHRQERHFSVMFLDSAATVLHPLPLSQKTSAREWRIRVAPGSRAPEFSAMGSANHMFALMVLTAAASVLSLLLTIRAIRARIVLASMKSDFVSGVTHELKTPIALIRLVGDTLASGRATSAQAVQDYARLVCQKAAQLDKSINDLLTAARYTDAQGLGSIALGSADLLELVEDALEVYRPILERLEFRVDIDISPALPQVMVDRAAMIHVLENVVDNAIKYSPDTYVLTISAREAGRHVRIVIADRGIGIAKEDIAHLFERFYRGRNATVRGSGLGLAIAERIVRLHGGRIEVKSELGVGTEVSLFLVVVRHS